MPTNPAETLRTHKEGAILPRATNEEIKKLEVKRKEVQESLNKDKGERKKLNDEMAKSALETLRGIFKTTEYTKWKPIERFKKGDQIDDPQVKAGLIFPKNKEGQAGVYEFSSNHKGKIAYLRSKDDVLSLQILLFKVGVITNPKELDGDWGSRTEGFLKKFQEQWNRENSNRQISINGQFGPKFFVALEETLDLSSKKQLEMGSSVPPPLPKTNEKNLEMKDSLRQEALEKTATDKFVIDNVGILDKLDLKKAFDDLNKSGKIISKIDLQGKEWKEEKDKKEIFKSLGAGVKAINEFAKNRTKALNFLQTATIDLPALQDKIDEAKKNLKYSDNQKILNGFNNLINDTKNEVVKWFNERRIGNIKDFSAFTNKGGSIDSFTMPEVEKKVLNEIEIARIAPFLSEKLLSGLMEENTTKGDLYLFSNTEKNSSIKPTITSNGMEFNFDYSVYKQAKFLLDDDRGKLNTTISIGNDGNISIKGTLKTGLKENSKEVKQFRTNLQVYSNTVGIKFDGLKIEKPSEED